MVVDTSQSVALTREVLAELRKITPKPVRYVINTHWHDDHYIGDQVYREAFPDVDIVAHAQTFRDLPGEGASNRAQMIKGLPSMIAQLEDALRTGKNLKGADDHGRGARGVCKRPRVGRAIRQRSSGRADHHADDRRERSSRPSTGRTRDRHPVGRRRTQPGRSHRPSSGGEDRHRGGSGDLAGTAGRAKSSIKGWSAALERIRALQPSVIVPGHGPVMRDDSHLRMMGEMFSALSGQVDAAVSRGETLEEARKSVRLDDVARQAGRRLTAASVSVRLLRVGSWRCRRISRSDAEVARRRRCSQVAEASIDRRQS